jgi:hypothetical protein
MLGNVNMYIAMSALSFHVYLYVGAPKYIYIFIFAPEISEIQSVIA